MNKTNLGVALVTGASTGIGLDLARECAKNGFDLIIVANEPEIEKAGEELRQSTKVETVQANLATIEGVGRPYAAINGRPVAGPLANAGRGLGTGFLKLLPTQGDVMIDREDRLLAAI